MTVWTPERDALLRDLVAAGNTRAKCIAPLAALAGDPITGERQIGRRMHGLRLRLPADAYREVYKRACAGFKGAGRA